MVKAKQGVSFRIEENLNKRFHIKCVKDGRVMSAVLTKLIEKWLNGKVKV